MSIAVASPKPIPSALPEELPIFPLSGAVLLPHARLPLNIFEPRYLAMVEDALGKGRMIGMIQPSSGDESGKPPLYSIGCAGRITSFNETEDGRLLIVLTGICRFRIVAELAGNGIYRSIHPDWKPYLADLGETGSAELDRAHLIGLLQIYFKKNNISVDWNVVQSAPNDVLIPTIIMICPFASNEKQALLEAGTFAERVKMLTALLEMAASAQAESDVEFKH